MNNVEEFTQLLTQLNPYELSYLNELLQVYAEGQGSVPELPLEETQTDG